MLRDIIIIYHERLGDIARCFPLAKYYADKGRHVFIECKPQYHGLFQLVSYCTPISPGHMPKDAEVIDLQIWPDKFKDFEASGDNWMDFIYAPWPDCDRQIVFDSRRWQTFTRDVPKWVTSACLVFPSGYSQRNPPDPRAVILKSHELFPGVPVCVVGKGDLGCFELRSIPELVAWIESARHVLTVNSAPSILASAVRPSWHHIPDLDPRHDFIHENQIRVSR